MTTEQQIAAFSDDLDKLVLRYRMEFAMPLAAFVGVLEIRKHTLIAEVIAEVNGGGEDLDDGGDGETEPEEPV